MVLGCTELPLIVDDASAPVPTLDSTRLLARAALERKLPQIGHATRDAAARDLQRIEASVQQMREVLQQVQATSELEHRMSADEGGSAKAALGTCEMHALLNRLLAEHVRHASVDTAQLSSFEQAERWVVAGGLERVLLMIRNLVDNAIKYTPAGGEIAISVRREDGRAVIGIRDTGLGIDSAELPRIWDRLYRGDESRSERGLGLGLSLVKAIVEAHGGQIKVSSEGVPGQGSMFTIQLPTTPNQQPAF